MHYLVRFPKPLTRFGVRYDPDVILPHCQVSHSIGVVSVFGKHGATRRPYFDNSVIFKSLVRSSEPLDKRTLQYFVCELLALLFHLFQVPNSANFGEAGIFYKLSASIRYGVEWFDD
jgi:hypothetical protein